MSAIRSSVRPKSSKQNWGTIIKPEFGLGYQKLTQYEIQQSVNRLYTVNIAESRSYLRVNKKMTEEEKLKMVERLAKVDASKVPESDRSLRSSIYRDMGPVASFAWRGYN